MILCATELNIKISFTFAMPRATSTNPSKCEAGPGGKSLGSFQAEFRRSLSTTCCVCSVVEVGIDESVQDALKDIAFRPTALLHRYLPTCKELEYASVCQAGVAA